MNLAALKDILAFLDAHGVSADRATFQWYGPLVLVVVLYDNGGVPPFEDTAISGVRVACVESPY